MGRPPLDIADIFCRHGAAWRRPGDSASAS
jgi:hypothetical protein